MRHAGHMIRLRVLPMVLGLAIVTGCGSEALLSREAMDRARAQGVAPDLIYTVEIPGYELSEQSVGGVNEEGFGAFYVAGGGRQVELRVDRGTFSDGLCRDTPMKDVQPPNAEVTCEHDEVGWYRRGGGRHEYTAVRGDHYIRLGGRVEEVDRAALKTAVAGARHVAGDGDGDGDGDGGEEKGGGGGTTAPPPSPVERGDLPTNGDGAPDNEVGPGG